MSKINIKFEVIARSVRRGRGGHIQHTLHLINRGNADRGHGWATVPAGLDVICPPSFDAEPGDFVEFSLAKPSDEA